MEHGTTNSYVNGGCRCADCRAAWSAYMRPRNAARRAPARETEPDDALYFVQVGEAGPIKIGVSKQQRLRTRVAALQMGNPQQLRFVGWLPGGHGEERELLARVADDRIRGEWFEPTERVLAEAAAADVEMPPHQES